VERRGNLNREKETGDLLVIQGMIEGESCTEGALPWRLNTGVLSATESQRRGLLDDKYKFSQFVINVAFRRGHKNGQCRGENLKTSPALGGGGGGGGVCVLLVSKRERKEP